MGVPWQRYQQQATKKSKKAVGPLVEGFIRVPFGDIEAIEEAAIHHPDIVAIFVEPIQGEGGVQHCSARL